MEQTMIKTENVSKRFGSFALQDIHFELPAGYICGLIGENGVGKTTLLNILAGLYEYDGTISIQEKEYRMHMAHPNGRVCGAKRPKCEAERSHHL